MTVQLSSLRVAADLQAGNYVAGAEAMAAANTDIASSGKAAGATVTQVQNKVNSAGDIWTRLSRQYVDGAGNAQKMSGALRTLQRGIDTGNVSMAQAEQILEGLNRKLGMMANAEELAASGQVQLAEAVSRVNARMAQAVPAHSAVGQVAGRNAFVMQNLAFQLNDVVSGFAMGQRPMQIFAQQGGQIVQAFAMGEGGVGGVLRSIGAMLLRFAPVLLPVAGVIAALSVGVAALGSKLSEGKAKALSFGDTLKGAFVTAWDAFTSQFGKAPEWLTNAWSGLGGIVADAVNNMIRAFAIFGVQVNETLATIGLSSQNVLAEQVVNPLSKILNGITNNINSASNGGRPLTAEEIAKTNIPMWKPTGTASDAAAHAAAQAQIAAINSTNYLGLVYKNGIASDPKKSKTKGATFSDLMDDLTTDTATLKAQQAALGQSTQQTGYLEEKQKLLNRALQQHIALTPDQIKQIDAAAQAYGRQKGILETLTDVYNTGKDAFQGFFSDLFGNAKKGESFWQSISDAALGALDKIETKILDVVTSQAWDALWTGGGSSGDGGLGNVVNGILGFFGLGGSGLGATTGPGVSLGSGYINRPHAAGGIISGPGTGTSDSIFARLSNGEFVVNAAATAAFRPQLEAINSQRYALGGFVGAANSNSPFAANANEPILIDVRVSVDDDGKLVAIAQAAGGQAGGQAAVKVAPGIVRQQLASGSSNSIMRSKFGMRPSAKLRS